jgi:hypothetical protein
MGILDTMKKNLDEFKKAEWKSDYNRKVEIPKKAKKVVVKQTEVATDVPEDDMPPTDDKGNYIKPRPYKKGGSVSSASKRADGCAVKGKTKGKMV